MAQYVKLLYGTSDFKYISFSSKIILLSLIKVGLLNGTVVYSDKLYSFFWYFFHSFWIANIIFPSDIFKAKEKIWSSYLYVLTIWWVKILIKEQAQPNIYT